MPKFTVYYRKNPTFRLDEDLYIADVTGENKTLGKPFVKLGTFNFRDRAEVFGNMQAEFMSKATLAKIRRIQEDPQTKIHTSMAVGDVIHDISSGKFYQCDTIGWNWVRY